MGAIGNPTAHAVFTRLEAELRKYLEQQLSTEYGPKWWTQVVPERVRGKCEERQQEDAERTWLQSRGTSLLQYADFIDLKEIILRKDNWEKCFKSCFGSNRGIIESKLDELHPIRLTIEHSRDLRPEDYEKLLLYAREIGLCIGVDVVAAAGGEPDAEMADSEAVDWCETPRRLVENQNLPRPDYLRFVGRKEYLKQVFEALQHDRAWVVSIDGVGGVGKTALAREVAETLRSLPPGSPSSFEFLVWTSAKESRLTPSGIDAQQVGFRNLDEVLSSIAGVTGFSEVLPLSLAHKKSQVLDILGAAKVLVILDNLETVEDKDVLRFLYELPRPSKALVTTRHRVEESQKNVRLLAMPMAEAREFVRQEAENLGVWDVLRRNETMTDQIIERTGAIPLAMKLVVARMNLGQSPDAVLASLAVADTADILEFCFEQSYCLLGSRSQETFLVLSIFDMPATREEVSIVSGTKGSELDQALADLVRCSLANVQYDEGRATDLYSLLPLTRAFARGQLASRPGLEQKARESLGQYLVQRKEWDEALRQANEMWMVAGAGTEAERMAIMLTQAGFNAYQGGSYSHARELLERATSLAPGLSYPYQTWAFVEEQEGSFGTARQLYRKATAEAPDNPALWRYWGNMEYRLAGFEDSRSLYSKACGLDATDRAAQHRLAMSLVKLGLAKRDQNRRREAGELFLAAEDHFSHAFFDNVDEYRNRHHNVVNHHARSLNFLRLGNNDAARCGCQAGLQLEPANERLRRLWSDRHWEADQSGPEAQTA